jgi:hypothetical protein
MTRCDECERFTGRYNSTRRCCQVRLIALMPPKRRTAALDKIAREKGQKVADYAEHLAREELARWKAYRAGIVPPIA